MVPAGSGAFASKKHPLWSGSVAERAGAAVVEQQVVRFFDDQEEVGVEAGVCSPFRGASR